MANSNTRPLRIFLCHASVDKTTVRKLYFNLLRRGINAWLDQEKLLPGEDWEEEIPKALTESDVILVCLSKASIKKEGYVQREITIAVDKALEKPGKIFIIPTKLEECDIPPKIRKYQSVELFRAGEFNRLIQSLEKRAAELSIPSRVSLPPRLRKKLEQPKSQKEVKTEIDHNTKELYAQALALNPKNKHTQQYLRKTGEIKRLIENADDAYYAAEYDKAIQLYKQVLDLEADNKHAQEQLIKTQRNRLVKNTKPESMPTASLRLYKRSRSFIAVGDLTSARQLLRQAIDIAEEFGVNFTSAQDLLGNIQNALKAEEFKKKAFEELDTQQWAKAIDNLNSAANLDPTDDTVQVLLLHLRSLLKAQNLINGLNTGNEQIKGRAAANKEIREIIDLTNETTALSKLWQDVVKLFGDYNRKGISAREVALVGLSVGLVLFSMFWLLYVFPRNHAVLECDVVSPYLQATLNYPVYIANGDNDKIDITFTNVGAEVVDGSVVFAFDGPAKVRLVPPTNNNVIEFADFRRGEEKTVTVNFLVDEPFQFITNPSDYVDFKVCTANDNFNTFHIAMSPIYGLRKLIVFLWSTIAVSLVGLSWSLIKEWLLSIFRRGNR
jgi:tetratricopeptide (TPR) repeat protein